MKLRLQIAAAFIAVATSASAQNWSALENSRVASTASIEWTQVAPGNAGFANLMRAHPTIAGKFVQCPDMWNGYQTEDYGANWYGITDPDGDASFYHLRDFAYSPSSPDIAITIGSSRLWKSADGGKTWQDIKTCPWYKANDTSFESQSWMRKVASLAIDPTNPDIWFVAGGANVRMQEWMSCFKTMTQAAPHGEADPKRVLNIGKLWRTKNGGKSWQLVTDGLHPEAQIGRIIVNPLNTQEVIASSNYGIYRSENGGTSWTHISKGQLESNIIMDMDYYYNAKDKKFILYAIDQTQYIADGKTTKCQGGVYESKDAGKSWRKINGDLALDLNRLTGGVPHNYYQYIAMWFGKKVPEVKKFYPELPTEALQVFNMICADPSREGALYLGFADPQVQNSIMPGRLWTTTNSGEKWISTARLYEPAWEADKEYWEERGNPWKNNMSVGHQSDHMQNNKDYPLRSMRGLAVGVDGAVMIISDHSTMLSRDNGASWMQVDEEYTADGAIIGRGNSNLPGLTIVQNKELGSTLLGSGEHKVWIPKVEADGRTSLRYIPSAPETMNCMAHDPQNPKIVYGTSSRQAGKEVFWRSEDAGNTWGRWGIATPASKRWLDDYTTNGLIVDPTNSNNIYLGITNIQDKTKGHLAGFYRSTNNGKTFEQMTDGLPEITRINDIKFDPRDKSYKSLFAAAEISTNDYRSPVNKEGGLFHSSDRGETWTKVKTPESVKSVQFIEIDDTNRIYITTGYRGGGAGVWYTDTYGKKWTQCFKYPSTESIHVSPHDNNLIVVSVRFLSKNPGLYLSRDRGASWEKCNGSITIPHQIEDVKFDLFESDKLWLATLGCGYYRGVLKPASESTKKKKK